jgi:hypothetical protein
MRYAGDRKPARRDAAGARGLGGVGKADAQPFPGTRCSPRRPTLVPPVEHESPVRPLLRPPWRTTQGKRPAAGEREGRHSEGIVGGGTLSMRSGFAANFWRCRVAAAGGHVPPDGPHPLAPSPTGPTGRGGPVAGAPTQGGAPFDSPSARSARSGSLRTCPGLSSCAPPGYARGRPSGLVRLRRADGWGSADAAPLADRGWEGGGAIGGGARTLLMGPGVIRGATLVAPGTG